MIKLVVSDLDGTLFYPKRYLSGMIRKNRDFLRNFLASGKEVLLASGRSISVVPHLEKALKHPISFLGCNGTFLYENGKFADRMPLDKRKLLELVLSNYDDYGIQAWFLFDDTDTLYAGVTKQTPEFVRQIAKFVMGHIGFYSMNLERDRKVFFHELCHHDSFKMMPVFGFGKKQSRNANQAYMALKAQFGDVFNIVVSGITIEITNKGSNKGTGVMEYCKRHGILPEEVMVIGDSGNDLEMFSRFPHSFAMASAPKHIQAGANHVVKGVYGMQEYLDHEELMKDDRIKTVDYEKALSQII